MKLTERPMPTVLPELKMAENKYVNQPDENLPSGPFGPPLSPYSRLRRFSSLLTSLIALIPLAILTFINYHQDTDAYRAENRYAISRILSNTKRTLEFVLEERRSALSFVLREKHYEELNTNEGLANTLQNLKNSFGGFIDLGIIDSGGIQRSYVGPYNLAGINYRDQDWFEEVILRGVHVSDVFMGHRNFPHFVIAFKKEKPGGDFYVLRATLDMELLTRLIYNLELDRRTDAFIINQNGIIQTPSVFYGGVLERARFEVPPFMMDREVIDEYLEEGQWLTTGYAYISESPYILMVMKRLDKPFWHWVDHRADLLWFLGISAALILVVVFYSTTYMVNRLKESDLKRARVFHNAEYTNKMATIGRMAAGVAHEINNPLAIINEKAGLLKDMAEHTPEYPQKEKTLIQINSIIKSVERCSNVTHRLLGFSRRMEVQKENIDLADLLKEVMGFQSSEIMHRNIIVESSFAPELPSLESDRGQLQQVFLNIFNNALAAIPNGGQIEITAAPINSGEVAVTVTDNGVGIPEKDLKHIFEPFFSTKGEFGTGLGLSITQDIVQKLGGRITVNSAVGTGTSFIVTLPLKSRG